MLRYNIIYKYFNQGTTMNKIPLFIAISSLLSQATWAQTVQPVETDKALLDKVVVTADPFNSSVEGIVQPAEVLSGKELDAKKSNTLGESIGSLVGVSTSYFGPGVGRPVIRGLDGPRVAVLSNGLASDDVSNVSQDHAVTIEPFLSDQIEVIKGPTTLLYGGGAIGGIVNASDGRIATSALEPGISGRAETRYDNGSNGFTQLLRTDWSSDTAALHFDGVYRDNDDIAGPNGDIANSAVSTRTGAVGGSVFSDWGYVGASLSRYLNDYGNPAEPGDGINPGVTLAMQQTRFESKAGYNKPFIGLDQIKLSYSYTDYQHTEFEGEAIGTQFFSTGHQFRAEGLHTYSSDHQGVFGFQAQQKKFEAIGAEAFIPPSESSGGGLFFVDQYNWGKVKTEFGGRYDRNKTQADGFNQRKFDLFTLSAAARLPLGTSFDLTANLDSAQRAPVEEELYSNGIHAATGAYEIGNPNMVKESALQGEIGLHYHSKAFELKASVYRNNYSDFIYLTDTGLFFDDGGDLLPIRQWSQTDANFTGYELEGTLKLAQSEDYTSNIRLFTDGVKAKKDAGGYLPRIPANRWGGEWLWDTTNWNGNVLLVHTLEQTDIDTFETSTDSYTILNAYVAYRFINGTNTTWEAFLQGNNLTNQEARAATSAIKDLVPLPGRTVSLGFRIFF